jgi:hypothetical protein
MRRIVHAILPALAVFALASGAAALPPEHPAPEHPAPEHPAPEHPAPEHPAPGPSAPGQPDEPTMRRIAASATPPPLATARAKLNAVLAQRLRAAAATSLNPIPAARPVPPPRALAPCSTPAITGVRGEPNGDGTVTPDNNFSITGCALGTTPGSATIVGPGLGAPLQLTLVPVCASADFKSEISCWQDSGAVFHVPHLQGVGDSPATLVVTMANGQTLRSPVSFVALRQTALVYGDPPISGKCSHATNNDDCVTTQSGPLQVDFAPGSTNYSILALHQSICCFNGVRDHDDYQVALMAQWTVASVEIAPDAQLPYCSNAFSSPNRPISSATLETPVFSAGKSAVSFRVDYSVGPVCSEIVYAIAIVARGPLGTFYDIKPPPGHR